MLTRLLIGTVRAYQLLLSPLFFALGAECRFHPTCSAYAIEALTKYGPWRGTVRAVGRVLRCQPWHPGGFDPP